MGGGHAIADMFDRQRLGRRQDGLEILQAVDDNPKRRHQLAALLGHVIAEQTLRFRRDVEQTAIKQAGRHVGDRNDFGER